MTTPEKLIQMVIAVAVFYGVVAIIMLLTQRLRSSSGERVQTAAFLAPSLLLIGVGLLYPAAKTIYDSFFGGSIFTKEFVALENYQQLFTDANQLDVLRNMSPQVCGQDLYSAKKGAGVIGGHGGEDTRSIN